VLRGQARVRQVCQYDGEGGVGAHLGITVRAHQAERRLRARAGHRGQQVERVDAGPLEIVEQQQRATSRAGRGLGRHVGQEAAHRLEHQPALLFGRQRPGRQRVDGSFGQLGQQAHQPGAAAQTGAQPRARLRADVGLECGEQGRVGLPEGHADGAALAATCQYGSALGDGEARRLGEQARLADAGLSGEQHHGSRQPRQVALVREVALQQGPLGGAPDEKIF
jgi:hypothetical protein